MRIRWLCCVLPVIALGGVGCVQLPSPWQSRPAGVLSEEELREGLIAYLHSFSAIVVGTADTIAHGAPDPQTRRRTLFWKLRMVPLAQDAALLDDPRQSYGALTGVAVAMRLYLTEGDGREIFGEQQPLAVQSAQRAEAELAELGAAFLTQEELARLRNDAEETMRRRPISGRDFSVTTLVSTRSEARQAGTFDWITAVPLSPFRALEGVGEGAAAIRAFNDTAIRFAAIVEGLPEHVRWQVELMLSDVESLDTTERSLTAVEALSESARRASAAFEALPQDTALLLESSRGAVAEAQAALRDARALLEPFRRVVAELNAAAVAWEPLLRGDDGGADDGRPFDIREWESALAETAVAAAELRALAAELQELGASEGVVQTGGVLQETVARAESAARDVVDHAAWRGAQLLLGAFAVLVLYRVVVARLRARSVPR